MALASMQLWKCWNPRLKENKNGLYIENPNAIKNNGF